MPIAYLIRAHHRPRQLARLIARLQTPEARFFIHVSAITSDETFGAMREALRDAPNVRWLPRVRTFYGGYSLVNATLLGVDAIVHSDPPPTHAVLLSGQDYPLRSAPEIERYFAERPGQSYLQYFQLPTSSHWPGESGGLDRIRGYYVEGLAFRTRLLRIPLVRRRFPAGLTAYGGSAWWALSFDALAELDRFAKEHPRVLDFFRHSKMPDELVVQTVLLNSRLRESIANEEIHYVEWPGGAHPATLTHEAVDRLLGSGKLFARKFDLHEDEEVLDLLDRRALGVAVAATP